MLDKRFVQVTIETQGEAFTVLLDAQTRVVALNQWLRRIGATRVTMGPALGARQTLAPARRYACSV